MTHEIVGPTRIDISYNREKTIAEPLDAYRVNEGKYGIATYTQVRPYLITVGLSACKALTFYEPNTQRGLMAHISFIHDTSRMIRGLVDQFGGHLEGIDIGVFGAYHSPTDITSSNWPTVDKIVEEILLFSPSRLIRDEHKDNKIRGISLNLKNGDLQEIDGTNGWTWSSQHETSLNRRLDEL